MGATTFSTIYVGTKKPRDAFRELIEEARYDHGHNGYTGTIAEKDHFLLIDSTTRTNISREIQMEIDTEDGRFADKYGPAGCIEIKSPSELKKYRAQFGAKGKKGIRAYVFFGWASC